jgi:hypothetical protein
MKPREEDGIPEDIVAVFDAPRYVDRYTVVLDDSWKGASGYVAMLGLSDDPEWPLGFSQFSDGLLGRHLGRRITFRALPLCVQRHVTRRLQRNMNIERAGEDADAAEKDPY